MANWSCIQRTVNVNSLAGFRLDDPDMAVAGLFVAEVAKVPAKIWVYVHAEVGTSPAYTARIETVGSGLPNGIYDANATADFTATAAGWISATFASAPAALTKGTYYAIVVFPSGTPTAANYIEVRYHATSIMLSVNRKRIEKDASGTWGSATAVLCPPYVVIEFDDGTTLWPLDGDHAMVNGLTNPGSISSTNRVGVKFVAPVTGTLEYARVALRQSGASSDVTAVLRAVGGGADLATAVIPYTTVGTALVLADIVFATPPSVTAGSSYVLYFRVTSGTAWQMLVASMGASCPPLPQHLREMTYIAGNAEPPATADAQYQPIAQFYFNPTTISPRGIKDVFGVEGVRVY